MTTHRSQLDPHSDAPRGDLRAGQRALHPLVSPDDVELARHCGMDPRDVSALRQFASERFLIVVRCPRPAAQAGEGARRATRRRPRPKTGAHRVVVSPRPAAPPACDLMSVWKIVGGRPTKVRVAPRGDDALASVSFEAAMIVLELNSRLVARVGHVCQDDDPSRARPAVLPGDRFIAFGHGGATLLPDTAACAHYYREHGLDWPHDE